MRNLKAIEGPRLWRSVGANLLALAGAAVLAVRPPAREPPRPAPEPPEPERRIRVVQLPKPPPPEKTPPPPPAAHAARTPPQAQSEKPAPAPRPLQRIAADSTAVQGVRLRVLVPRSPGDLAAHLRN